MASVACRGTIAVALPMFLIATKLLVAAAWSPPSILCPRTPLRPARGAILLHAATPSTDTLLCSGAAVELWHEGGLAVGNFRNRAEGSNALIVELSSGRSIKVDGGQLVDVWAADAGYPSTPDGWTSLQAEAAGLLAELPPHMLDLRPLWQRLLTEKAAARERVDSSRVAQELFTSPHRQGPSARQRLVQRLAAGQLLAAERSLFKRVPVELAQWSGDASSAADVPVRWARGGFKVLPRSTSSSQAEASLIEAMRARHASMRQEEAQGASPAGGEDGHEATAEAGSRGSSSSSSSSSGGGGVWPAATLPLLAEIEMVALGLGETSKQVARVLGSFDQPANATGARELLIEVGQWVEGEADASARLGYSSGAWLDPFPREALAEGAERAEEVRLRREGYKQIAPPALAPSAGAAASAAAGPRQVGWLSWLPSAAEEEAACQVDDRDEGCNGLHGRVDLRSRCPRVYAIDSDSTDFRDDAISYDAQSRTLTVHISDLTSVVRPNTLLDDVARLRLQTIYSGAMPLHMLPPPLLRASCLSDRQPNEGLSAVLQLDAFGRVRHSRLVRSVLPPVRILSFEQVDVLLSDTSIDSQVHRELRALAEVTRRRALSRTRGASAGGEASTSEGSRRPEPSPAPSAATPPPAMDAHTMVDEALGMFSYAARGAAKRHNLLRLPQTEARRIATAPLRRYADLIAQRQLTAALCGAPGMAATEVAAIERWIKHKQSELARAEEAAARQQAPLQQRALESLSARQASVAGSLLEGAVRAAVSPSAAHPEPAPRSGASRAAGGRAAGGRGAGGRGAGGRGAGGRGAGFGVYGAGLGSAGVDGAAGRGTGGRGGRGRGGGGRVAAAAKGQAREFS